jgi:serine/threonine-protein kinase
VSFYQGSQKRPPERLADRFRVLDEIGAGATAITYRGWDERLERSVAIKILRASVALDPTFVRRFQQEARAAASISHGNVVDVYDFGQQDDALYIVMQYVEGEDLKHLITREGALPVDRAREIAGQVLDGLRAIHAAGIIHRDIKPQNVLIGRDGVARLTDFGVAQVAEDSGMTTAGTTVGTAAYMAPEQAQAGRITEATDLYAVGVMLYEMLTGFLPFNAPTA